MQKKTIYSDIISGSAPAYKLHEDQHTIAFLDIKPVTKGHALVVPKIAIDHLDEASPQQYRAIFDSVQHVSKLLKKKLHPERIAIVVHGYEIPHAHVHVVPMYSSKDLTLADRSKSTINHDELRDVLTLLGGTIQGEF